MLSDREWERIDATIDTAASEILTALERMLAALPEEAAPAIAMERLGAKLVAEEPHLIKWMIENEEVKALLVESLMDHPAGSA